MAVGGQLQKRRKTTQDISLPIQAHVIAAVLQPNPTWSLFDHIVFMLMMHQRLLG